MALNVALVRNTRRWRRWGRTSLVVLGAVIVVPPIITEVAPDRPPGPGNSVGGGRETVAPPPPAPPRSGDGSRVFVADWGYHTSVILEQPAGARLGPPGRERARFVEYAWGDRRFYMESDYRPHALFATLLLPTESVVYVAAWDAPPDSTAARPRSLHARPVTAAQRAALIAMLERQIHRTAPSGTVAAHARAPAFPPAPGYAGRFYPAYGRYLWWNDCNRWTVDRLAEAGLAAGGRGVIFSGQVAPRLLGFSAVARRPAA